AKLVTGVQTCALPIYEISGFEPELAFNGGTFGISILTRFLREAPRFLKPASWLALEVGAGQGLGIARQLAKNPAVSIVEPRTDRSEERRVGKEWRWQW